MLRNTKVTGWFTVNPVIDNLIAKIHNRILAAVL
jgi:hypothetical protein